MRIRTIKPEWWSHPVMSRLDDKTRLVAIGLLNLADDEGYFMADPLFVKSQLFPFTEDSLRIHGALTTLSTIGWIEAIKHPTHGPIARVVNFRKHQKINRPTPSKIKAYWINDDSLRIHGGLTEGSLLEQGTGNREQGTGNRERISVTASTLPADCHAQDDLFSGPPSNSPIEKPEDDGILPFCERNYSKIYKKAQVLQFKVFENNWMSWQAVFKTYDDETIKEAKEITISSQRVPAVIDDICKLIKTGEEKRKIQPRWTTLEAAEEWERHINPEFKCFAKPDDMKKHWPRLRIESIKNYLKNCGYDLERAK